MVGVALAVSEYWERKQPVFQNAPKLIAALRAFSRDQSASGLQLPPEVSLQDLLGGGYLTAQDVRPFEGMDVTLCTHYDERMPQLILARARIRDGQVICLLLDGSVQGFTASIYKELLENSGHPYGAASGDQPTRSETNRASRAAGFRR